MCRLLAIIGQWGELSAYHESLVDALIQAASNDPYGERLYGELRHSDGWGRLILTNGDSIILHKSINPIYADESVKSISIKQGGLFIEFIHARAASEGTPINMQSTHPVHSVTVSGSELFMMHNGSFRKGELVKLLNLNEAYASNVNDTYVANLALASRIKDDLTQNDLRWLLGYTKSGANLGIMLLNSTSIEVIMGSFYRLLNDGKDDARANYYKLYRCRLGDSLVYSSSTIVDYYKPSGLSDCVQLKNGEFHKYTIDPSKGGRIISEESWLIAPGDG